MRAAKYSVKQVLAQVNRIRRRRGMEPIAALPPGVLAKGAVCPLQRALEAPLGVCRGSAHYGHGDKEMFPRGGVLYTFVGDFDEQLYPDLIEQ